MVGSRNKQEKNTRNGKKHVFITTARCSQNCLMYTESKCTSFGQGNLSMYHKLLECRNWLPKHRTDKGHIYGTTKSLLYTRIKYPTDTANEVNSGYISTAYLAPFRVCLNDSMMSRTRVIHFHVWRRRVASLRHHVSSVTLSNDTPPAACQTNMPREYQEATSRR